MSGHRNRGRGPRRSHPREHQIHLLDGGHFLLESAGAEVAALIRAFLARRLAAGS